MRIALVGLTHPFRGGISHYTTLLCRALRERHEVTFYALSRQYPALLFPGQTQKDLSSAPMAVDNVACLDSCDPISWITTASRIRSFRPDLVLFSWWHPFFAPSFGTVAHQCRLYRLRTCFLCHNAVPHERSWIDVLLLRYVFAAASIFITHSTEDAANLKKLRPRAHILQSPHPTYAAFAPEAVPSREEAKQALGLTDRRVLLFFGFIRAYKGLDTLLQAMLRLGVETDYHLLIVGEFYEARDRYEADLATLETRGQVTLVDRYVANEEVPTYFSGADIVVLPYLTASQSGIVQLAYGFGRPVVATTVGGLPEVVVDGETGTLAPPADAGALAAAIERCAHIDTSQLDAALARERHRFSWESMVEKVEAAACHEATIEYVPGAPS